MLADTIFSPDPSIRVTWMGCLVNVLLSLLKIVVGMMVQSISLVADGIHSVSDLLTDAAVLVGVRMGSRPADANHPYGHGKIETFAALFVSVVLALVAGGIIWNSAAAFFTDTVVLSPPWVIAAALVSMGAKEWLFRVTRRVARKVNSAAVMANAWHHRSDALSSVAVLAGAVLSAWGWAYGDALAGVIVGVMVVLASLSILVEAMMELTEAAVEDRFQQGLSEILNDTEGVRGWHACRGRHVGRQIFLDCHIEVDPDMSVFESHKITGYIKRRLRERLGLPVNLLIHVEPHMDDESKSQKP